MSGYAMRAACRGHRPSPFSSYAGYQRSQLVARLLKERSVARFIVAPDGYGKSSLAVEYAETMFAWEHVFWLNAQSPCFLRDLDACTLVPDCFDFDPEADLVVIDDLPLLDADRAKKLSDVIDAIIARGCEVVVTCVPSCDVPGQHQLDRICIRALDLLLTDEELDEARAAEERMRLPSAHMAESRRIPVLVWKRDSPAAEAFARNVLKEELPADVLLLLASALVLHVGTYDDLDSIVPMDRQTLASLSRDYPHIGYNEDALSFESALLEIESLAAGVKRVMEGIVARSRFQTREELAAAWADILLKNGQASRACDVMRMIPGRHARAEWLVGNAYELVRQHCFFASLLIARDQREIAAAAKSRMMAFEALCLRALGDEAGALKCAKKPAFDERSPWDVRACSALVVLRLSSGALAQQAMAVLAAAAEEARWEAGSWWPYLIDARLAKAEGYGALVGKWELMREEGAPDEVLCICASWVYAMLGRREGETEEALAAQSVVQRPIERYVQALLLSQQSGCPDYYSASAGLSLEEAHGRGMPYCDDEIASRSLFALRQVEINVLAQRGLFERSVREGRMRREERLATRPDSYLTAPTASLVDAARSIPVLTLKLFGSFEVLIGDEPVDQGCFKRQNVRSLLVLLAVNQGKELPRDQVSKTMWPHADSEVARKNFYTVWAQLRRSLTLDDGTCPYLIRRQYGCSLEQRYVKSDVQRLSEICRDLMFSTPDIERWSALFTEIDRDFSSDLMPSENKNQLVVQARGEYRSRLVDALVAATFSVIDAGYPQWGIWFARAAISHDETREDAYVALMRSQVAGGQRTAAMMTYLKCRRALEEGLGIDPSPETTALYESLLDSEVKKGA